MTSISVWMAKPVLGLALLRGEDPLGLAGLEEHLGGGGVDRRLGKGGGEGSGFRVQGDEDDDALRRRTTIW